MLVRVENKHFVCKNGMCIEQWVLPCICQLCILLTMMEINDILGVTILVTTWHGYRVIILRLSSQVVASGTDP